MRPSIRPTTPVPPKNSTKSSSKSLSIDDFAPPVPKSSPSQKSASKSLSLDDFAPSYAQSLTDKKVPESGRKLPASLKTSGASSSSVKPSAELPPPQDFHIKLMCHKILTLEEDMKGKDANTILKEVTPSGWSWIPKTNLEKTKRFYQLILIDSGSAEITPERIKVIPP